MKLRPVRRHENGPTWDFQVGPRYQRTWCAVKVLWWFRPGPSDLPRSCGLTARRMAGNHRRPSGPGTITGSLSHGVVTSLGGGISATPLGVTDVRGDLILAGASPINRPTRPNGPMSRSRCLQTADRSIRTRCGATRSGAAGTAVWICDRRQLRDWSHDKPDDIHHPRGGQSAIIADQLPTRQTSGRRGERRPDVPGATDPERSATDCRHRRVQ